MPSNWPLIPSNLNTGDEFRLLLRIQLKRHANSENIGDYDAFVQEEISAKGHVEIKAYSSHFQVLGSTATVNARTHTGTTGSGGVRIHWLNGLKVANNYADFYDGSWPNGRAARTEAGVEVPESQLFQNICTGTADDGTTTSNPMGAAMCTATQLRDIGNTLSGESVSSTEESRVLALSGVFRVGNFTASTIPEVESVAFTSDPGSDGEYVKDDAIEVTVTFSEAVAVTGTPRMKVRLAKPKNAAYVESDSTATELTFKYTVRAADYSHDGINLVKNGLVLSGGTIKNQAGDTNANLDHDRTQPDSDHKVHVRPTVSSVTVASTPSYATSYATGDTIQIDLTFNRKVRVFTAAGTPTLGVIIGSTRREAAYTTTVGDTVVRFGYVVQAGDLDTDGISLMSNAITWNGGFIIRQEHGNISDKATFWWLKTATLPPARTRSPVTRCMQKLHPESIFRRPR